MFYLAPLDQRLDQFRQKRAFLSHLIVSHYLSLQNAVLNRKRTRNQSLKK